MAIKFSGINIFSKDAMAAYEFYKGLGLAANKVDEDYSNQWWCAEFDINGSTLWIWKGQDGNSANCVELVMNCCGLDAMNKLYEDLKAKGYAVSKPEQQFYGGWEMHLVDPDGNKILFLD